MKTIAPGPVLTLASLIVAVALQPSIAAESPDWAQRCTGLAKLAAGAFRDTSTRLASASVVMKGPLSVPLPVPGLPPQAIEVPDHCEIQGIAQERTAAG